MAIPSVDAAYSNAGTGLSAGASYMARFVSNIIANGGIAKSSGDGTTFNASGWGGALNTPNAWVRVKIPQGEFVVQKDSSGTTSYNWAISTSVAGFTGGSAAVAATATDQRYVWGAIGPAPGTFFPTTSPADYTMHTIILPGAPMAIAMIVISNGTGAPVAGFMIDPLRTGTFTALDSDPVVYAASGGGSGTTYVSGSLRASNVTNPVATAGVSASPGVRGLLNNATFTGLGVFGPTDGGGTNIWPGALGVNPLSGKDPMLWADYGRLSSLGAPIGGKGESSLCKLKLTARNTNDRFSLVTTGDHIVIGDLVFPWDGSATSGVTYSAEMFQQLASAKNYKLQGYYVAGAQLITGVASSPTAAPSTWSPSTAFALTDIQVVGIY